MLRGLLRKVLRCKGEKPHKTVNSRKWSGRQDPHEDAENDRHTNNPFDRSSSKIIQHCGNFALAERRLIGSQ